jgi:sphingolipid 8-(E)-desaturase
MAPRTSKDRIWSRREIEGLIAQGRKIIILDGQVMKADAWLPYHPGGNLSILHMVGRDATDEIRALHSIDAQVHMQKYIIGRIEGRWENFDPPIRGGTFRGYEAVQEEEQATTYDRDSSSSSSSTAPSPIFETLDASQRHRATTDSSSVTSLDTDVELPGPASEKHTFICSNPSNELGNYPSLEDVSQDEIVAKYRELDIRMRAEGLYDCNYSAYAWEISRYLFLFASFLACLRIGQWLPAGVFLGLFWHQLVFTAHDAGHMGITHNFHIDTCIGIFIADFCGGLSIGWWKRSHNVHHIVTNSPEHDPDIEHMPFFAITTRLFNSLYSTYHNKSMTFDAFARWFISKQQYLYYPILSLAHFNLYVQSYIYLLSKAPPRRGPAWWHWYLELAGIVTFWYWFGYQVCTLAIPDGWSRFIFIMTCHIVSSPLHVQITLSHFAMSTADLGGKESFPQKMLRTTMDVDCPAWLDWLHGGLQFQAVHHLYPRMPRHNLRKAQKYVKEFCAETGIPYVIYGFAKGNAEVLGRLEQVARQVKYFDECRKVAAKDLLEGHAH